MQLDGIEKKEEDAQITIKDIAEKLNISASTVSRALHDHPDISVDTKKRVVDLAQELDYQPNNIAQSLQKKRTKTIGVIVPEFKHDFFSFVLDGIEDVAYKAGYTIIVSKSNESCEREVINTKALVSNRVAGLLVSVSQNTNNIDHFKRVQRKGIPLVFFDRVADGIEASKVVVDDYYGAFTAVEYLIQCGYTRIAHMAGPQQLSIGIERYRGYRDALQKYELPLSEKLVVFGGLNEEDGVSGFQTLMMKNEAPDAIFAVNDPVAIGAYMNIKKRGMHIPSDIALVGFSDNPIASLIDPPLTTIAQPSYQIGAAAANLLLNQIRTTDKPFEPKIEVLNTKLIIRSST